jgi:Fur family zinc uptake transcriptional regulator
MKAEDVIKHAEQSCNENGGRLTKKRKQILQLLLDNHGPLSAYELADLYHEVTHEKIPAMSVYRMLDFLIEFKLVHKLASTNKFMACSHIACDHEHKTPQFLICDDCNSVNEIDIDSKLIGALEKSIEDKQFKLKSPQLELHGVCESCQSK